MGGEKNNTYQGYVFQFIDVLCTADVILFAEIYICRLFTQVQFQVLIFTVKDDISRKQNPKHAFEQHFRHQVTLINILINVYVNIPKI